MTWTKFLVPETLTFAMFTMPWNRRIAHRWELYGTLLGLNIQHDHDGGRTLRYHVITATGPDWAVQRYSKTYDRYHRLKVGRPADRATETADLLARITKKTGWPTEETGDTR